MCALQEVMPASKWWKGCSCVRSRREHSASSLPTSASSASSSNAKVKAEKQRRRSTFVSLPGCTRETQDILDCDFYTPRSCAALSASPKRNSNDCASSSDSSPIHFEIEKLVAEAERLFNNGFCFDALSTAELALQKIGKLPDKDSDYETRAKAIQSRAKTDCESFGRVTAQLRATTQGGACPSEHSSRNNGKAKDESKSKQAAWQSIQADETIVVDMKLDKSAGCCWMSSQVTASQQYFCQFPSLEKSFTNGLPQLLPILFLLFSNILSTYLINSSILKP